MTGHTLNLKEHVAVYFKMASLFVYGFTFISLQSNGLSETNDDSVTSSDKENVDSSTEDHAPRLKGNSRKNGWGNGIG